MIPQVVALARIWNRQWMSPENLEAFQVKRLRETITGAYQNVPYYRQLFDRHNIQPSDIRTLNDLRKIPVSSKDDIKKAGDAIFSGTYPKENLTSKATSGSTGIPLNIYRNRHTQLLSQVSRTRIYITNGYRLHQRVAQLNFYPPNRKFFHKLGLHKKLRIPLDRDLPRQSEAFLNLKAPVIETRPSSLVELIGYFEANDIQTHQIKLIFSHSEPLLEFQRQAIQNYFGVNPIDIYGSEECKDIAWECQSHEGYHINADFLHVEIMSMEDITRPANEGEKGYVVITDFSNPAMPFIRFNMEDIAVLSNHSCSCGRGFPLLKHFWGRKSGFLTLPSGNKIPGTTALSSILCKLEQIQQYRSTQLQDGRLDVFLKVAPGKTVPEEEIIHDIQYKCEDIPVEIHYVDDFHLSPEEKLTPFVSEIK